MMHFRFGICDCRRAPPEGSTVVSLGTMPRTTKKLRQGGTHCSAISCTNSKYAFPDKSFFRFPVKDVPRCQTWRQNCRRDDLPKDVEKLPYIFLCADHFEDSQFMNATTKNRLIWCAVPTLFTLSNPPPPLTYESGLTECSASAQNDQAGLTQSSVHGQAQLSGSRAQRKSSLLKCCSVKGQAGLSSVESQVTWVSLLIDRKVYTLWRQIKGVSFLSDTNIASFLLNFYDENREAPSSCTRCSCPLIHVCISQEENADMTLKKPNHEHEEEEKEDIEMPDITPSCEQRPGQNGGVTADKLSAVDTFIKLEPQPDQATEHVERAVKTQEEILKETISDEQPGPKNWTTIELSGNVYRKWCEVKGRLFLQEHNQLAIFLLRVFNEEARPGCVKCASPMWHLCAACLQRSVEGGLGENENTSISVSLDMKLMGLESLKQLDNFACRDKKTVSLSDLENRPKDMEGCGQSGTQKHNGLAPKCFFFIENDTQTKGIKSDYKGKRKWKKKYFCKYCLKVFLSLNELKVHRKADHAAKYKKKRVKKSVSCLQSFTSKKEKTNHLKEELRRLCDRCGLMMTMSLSVHMRVHTQEKPYECNVCHRTFTQSSSLTKHKQTHTQLENRTHQCSTCSKRFCSRTSLQNHQLVHTKEKPYNCLTCGRAFSGKCNLVRHRLVHTGEKPYMCDICGDRFSQFTNMQSHKKVHSDSSRRQIRKRRGMVKPKRMEKQKSKACLVCGKTFSLPGNLSRHKLLHSNCRQFLCYLCGKSFNSYDNLTAHEKIHL